MPFEHGARLTAQAEGCQVCGRPADFPPLKPRGFRIKIPLRAAKTARRGMARKARFRTFVRSVVAKKRYAKKCCYGLRSSRELALTSRFQVTCRTNETEGRHKTDPLFWRGRRDLPFEHGARLTAQAEGCQVCGRPADFPPLKPRGFRIKIPLRAAKTARRGMARKARFELALRFPVLLP